MREEEDREPFASTEARREDELDEEVPPFLSVRR